MGYNRLSIPTSPPREALPAPAALASASTRSRADAHTVALADGTVLELRCIGAADTGGLAALFARLSPESRRRRFLSPKAELTPRELEYFTDIDHVRHEAVAAIDRRDGSIVGVARYAHDAERPSVAEVAVEVIDEMHGIGIGTALLAQIVRRAWGNGFTLLTAVTLWENRPARALLRRLQFSARASHGSEIEYELERECTASDAPPATVVMLARMVHSRTRSARIVI